MFRHSRLTMNLVQGAVFNIPHFVLSACLTARRTLADIDIKKFKLISNKLLTFYRSCFHHPRLRGEECRRPHCVLS